MFLKRVPILCCLLLLAGSPVYANTFLFKKTFGFHSGDPVIWSVPVPSTNPHDPSYFKGTVSEIFIVRVPTYLWISIRKSDIQTNGSIRLLPLGNALNNIAENNTNTDKDFIINAKDNNNQWAQVANKDDDSFILIENAHNLPTAGDTQNERVILRVSLKTITRDTTPNVTGVSVRIHKPNSNSESGGVAHSAAHVIRYTVSQSVFDRDDDGDVDQADVDAGALDFDEDGDTDQADTTLHQSARDAHQSQASPADSVASLSGRELLVLGALLTHDTLIFSKLHNGSVDTHDWLELRNVSDTDLLLNDWRLTLHTSSGEVVISFPTGTVIPANAALLLTNTAGTAETSIAAVVDERFALPQAAFTLSLRSPLAFGDIAGNYLSGKPLETAPAFTVDTVWYRSQPIALGYRAESWSSSATGHPDSAMDVNSDGVINILDLVLVASQFSITPTMAGDVNSDGVVNVQDLVLVANAFGSIVGAPAAQQ